MKWNRSEIDRLSPILEQISADLAPVDGKSILILGSANGELVFRLAEMMEFGKVTGLELNPEALQLAREAAHEMGLEEMVAFSSPEKDRLLVDDEAFDAIVSEIIIYPTDMPSNIEQGEMVRCLKPGGKMILTDVLLTRQLPETEREDLGVIGLDYLCEATPDDFKSWMQEAGLIDVKVEDLNETLRPVWQSREEADLAMSHHKAYEALLYDPSTRLGKAIFYIYATGRKTQPEQLV